jgi:hypothetical protein
MDLPLITFGKYKGQPVTSLLADVPYLEWCKKQHWFSKCTPIYNICMNQPVSSNLLKLEEENELLREKLLHNEEKYKKLEEEIILLKTEKLAKMMKDYFGKK